MVDVDVDTVAVSLVQSDTVRDRLKPVAARQGLAHRQQRADRHAWAHTREHRRLRGDEPIPSAGIRGRDTQRHQNGHGHRDDDAILHHRDLHPLATLATPPPMLAAFTFHQTGSSAGPRVVDIVRCERRETPQARALRAFPALMCRV